MARAVMKTSGVGTADGIRELQRLQLSVWQSLRDAGAIGDHRHPQRKQRYSASFFGHSAIHLHPAVRDKAAYNGICGDSAPSDTVSVHCDGEGRTMPAQDTGPDAVGGSEVQTAIRDMEALLEAGLMTQCDGQHAMQACSFQLCPKEAEQWRWR